MIHFVSHCVLLSALTYALSPTPLSLITRHTYISRITHTSHRYWRFVSLRFLPTEAAQTAYLTHTKRQWVGASADTNTTTTTATNQGGQTNSQKGNTPVKSVKRYEETVLFYEEDEFGVPVTSHARGAVHAVLPTKLTLPCALQWQGAWLLSVDRQEVQVRLYVFMYSHCVLSYQAPTPLLALPTKQLTNDHLPTSLIHMSAPNSIHTLPHIHTYTYIHKYKYIHIFIHAYTMYRM